MGLLDPRSGHIQGRLSSLSRDPHKRQQALREKKQTTEEESKESMASSSSSSPPSTSTSLARLHRLLTSRYGPLISVHSSASVRGTLSETCSLSAAQLLAPAGERVQLNGTGCDRC